MHNPAGPDRSATEYPPFSTALICLFGLMIACFFSFLDRQILNLLVQPIRQDLGISDTQIGVLQGIAFALSYSVMALPFGWMADRFHRVRLVCLGVAMWSLATIGMGMSDSFNELLVARVLVGVGEATLMPAAYSLLADYFPPLQRGRAFAAYMSAVMLGHGGALVAGGAVLRLLGGIDTVWLPVFGPTPVWQAAFLVVGAPGLVLSMVLLLLREPPRRGHSPGSVNVAGLTTYVGQHKWAFFSVLGAYSLLALLGHAATTWAPTLLIRNYGLDPANAGLTTGVSLLLAGLASAAIAGIVGDRWVARRRYGGRFPLIYAVMIGGFPALALFGLSGDLRLAVAGFLLYGLVTGVGYTSSAAVMQEMVPSHLRGRVVAFWYLITGILGNGMGPVVAGAMNDHVFRSDAALPYSLLAIAGPSLLLGLILTASGMAAYAKASGYTRNSHPHRISEMERSSQC